MQNEEAIELLKHTIVIDINDERRAQKQEAIRMGADALSAERKWIPVSDRVPEDDRLVIVCTESGQVYTDYYFDDKPDFWRLAHIIAWQDLPKAYKKEDSNGKLQ